MEYVRLGSSGLKVSRLSLGAMGIGDPAWRSWVLAEDETRPIVRRALDHGINLIDTCDNYSKGASEALIGRLLNGFINRKDILIATKFGLATGKDPNQAGYSRKHVIESVDASLLRLGVDHIDIYQTHIWDHNTNIEEMIVAFADLVRAGKVLYVGATDMPTWQFAKAVTIAKAKGLPHFISMQCHYNLIWRGFESELFPFCRHEGIGLLPYSPVARGFLSGAERRQKKLTERARTDNLAWEWYNRPVDERIADVVESIAEKRGVSPSQIAMAWVLQQPGISSSVFGPTKPAHVDEAVAALGIVLSVEERGALEEQYQPRLKYGH
jgi:aryl-alcohol dehydrogenase-like predicted oxidoreductase